MACDSDCNGEVGCRPCGHQHGVTKTKPPPQNPARFTTIATQCQSQKLNKKDANMANVSGANEGLATGLPESKPFETVILGLSLYGTHSMPADPLSVSASSECLTLYFALSSRGHAKVQGKSFRITTVTLKATLREAEIKPRLDLSLSEGIAPMLIGTLHWGLTRDKFDSLAASLRDAAWGASLRLHVWLPSEVDLSQGFASCGECLLDLGVCAQSEHEQKAAKRLLGDALCDAFESAHFERHGRASRIAEEFSQSIGKAVASPGEAQLLVDAALEVMSAFRAAVRPQSWDDTSAVDWGLPRDAFEAANSSKSDWDVLKRGYDTMWRHFSVLSIMHSGEKTSGPQTEGYVPRVQELEDCAWQLLKQPALRSVTLERQIIDALVFCENLAFAQMVLVKQRGTDPMRTYELGPSAQFKVGKALWGSLRQAAWEIVLLLGTWMLASAISNGHTLATWSFFLAGTLTRWMFKKLNDLKVASEASAQPEKLLMAMAQGYELLKHPYFHRGAVRQELQRLTSLGAVYSPFVFELLERN